MKRIITLILTLLLGIGIFIMLMEPGNVVNFIPYSVHNSLKIEIISENNFILFFDLFLSILISSISFFIIKRFINK